MKHRLIFRLLTAAGHSGFLAGQILLDAQRGNEHARRWIGIHFKQRRTNQQINRTIPGKVI